MSQWSQRYSGQWSQWPSITMFPVSHSVPSVTPCKSYERVILPAFLDQRAGGRVGTSVRAPAAKAAEVTLPRNPACICRSARGRSWRSWRPRSRPYIDGRRPRSDDLRILPVSVERAAGRLVCGVRGRNDLKSVYFFSNMASWRGRSR